MKTKRQKCDQCAGPDAAVPGPVPVTRPTQFNFYPSGVSPVPGAWCGDTACSGTGLGSPGGQETLDTLMQRCASFMANGQSDMLISNITPRTNGEIRRTLVLPQDKRRNVILIED